MRRFVTCVILAGVCAFFLFLMSFGTPVGADPRLISQDHGHVALGLALRKLNTVGRFLQTTAHPDDENNALLAWLSRGQGMRVALLTATRGNGGQNEIGPELFEDLAVIRTSELLSAHRLDGAEQYFTRAIDFGYSFSTDETFRKWGKEEILGDFVRMLRTLRPEVIVAMRPEGAGGGQHHQTTGLLTQEAFRAAADPARFPEQIREGLKPWQAKKLYFAAGGGFGRGAAPPAGPGIVAVDSDVFDPLLGRTYANIGAEARTMHKCQGMGQILPLPGMSTATYRLSDTVIPGQTGKAETSLFDGIDTSLAGLAQYAGATPPEALTQGLAAIATAATQAERAFETQGDAATIPPILAGLTAVRVLRQQLGALGLGDLASYELDFRLKAKEQDFQQAALVAHGIVLDALADDGLVVGGQPVKVSVLATNYGPKDVTIDSIAISGFDGTATCQPGSVTKGKVYTCASDVRVPAQAKITEPYWKPLPDLAREVFEPDAPFGLPFRPTPFRAAIRSKLSGADVDVDLPVRYRHSDDIFAGEKRMDLHVVPAFSVRATPDISIIPASSALVPTAGAAALAAQREVFVNVTNGIKGPASATVTLEAPRGWRLEPASAPIAFSREDEAVMLRIRVTPPAQVATGEYRLQVLVVSQATGAQRFDRGYQVVEYPHIERHHAYLGAQTRLKVVDVKTTANVTVGYVMGVGDAVPPVLRELGARLNFIDTNELAWGELSKYDVIFTRVRAYERRLDLRAYNRRLLDYVEAGGTVIVQYNKMEFNEAQYGPYPVKVSSSRVTEETAPIQIVVPDHPVFNVPNKIDENTWKGWVQERGLYFLGERDPQYVDLVQLEDPFEYNKGPKRGALVEARFGKGRWIYLALGLWRQVQAGTDGAYELLANLVSLGKAKQAQTAPAFRAPRPRSKDSRR